MSPSALDEVGEGGFLVGNREDAVLRTADGAGPGEGDFGARANGFA